MGKGLRLSLIAMGLFFILLGFFLNFQLYTSLAGDYPLYKYSYGAIGIGLDISKIICLILGAFLIKQAIGIFTVAGFVSLAFYIILALISWAAGWGFTLVVTQNYENQAFQRSAQARAVQAGIDDANAEVRRLSQYANSSMVYEGQSKMSQLQTQLDKLWAAPARNSLGQHTGKTIRSQLGGVCPGTSWYHKKYCPKIQSLESQMAKHETIIDNHATYLSAIEHKNAMIKNLGNMDLAAINPESVMHPLFIGMGTIFGIPPQMVKYRLLLLTSAMIELLGSLFFVIGLLIKKQTYSIAEIVVMEKQKQQMLAELGVDVIDLGKNEYIKLKMEHSNRKELKA
jgi:hypothetical protein